jgi:hypothetical protein
VKGVVVTLIERPLLGGDSMAFDRLKALLEHLILLHKPLKFLTTFVAGHLLVLTAAPALFSTSLPTFVLFLIAGI